MSTMQEQVNQLTRNGQWQEAIALLSEQNRLHADVALEKQLIDLRVQGFHHTQWPVPTTVFPPAIDAKLSLNTAATIPEIAATQLDAQILNKTVQQQGSLLVRNLVPSSMLEILRHNIEQAVTTRNQRAAGEVIDSNNPYYSPSQYLNTHHKLGVGRKFIAETGGVWAADSPRGLFDVMELYRQLQLKKLLTDYFGETPCVSVKKWVLRRVDPIAGEADWHQDGAFMGKDVRSMNLWIALTDCGGDSINPGIDIVPRRFDNIVQTGTDGARFDWTVGPAYVEKNFSDTPWLRPAFKAGDALFFDHMNLHRTAWSPSITGRRYAIECWFFAASASAHNQIPMLL
ncbi:MAG TPA: phytanoyl-CoA dioxygenase family protein [Pseudomonadales bacterium]|nr:phytanoyl-CoA dioxygenase family protein [Pseudomonadales bacterium]